MKTIEILSEMNIHFDEATDSLFAVSYTHLRAHET